MITMNTRRRPHDKRPTIEQSSPVVGDSVEENMEVLIERPPGKKAEKERERKSRESTDDDMKVALARMQENRHMCMVEKRAAVMKAEGNFTKQHELEKKKFEAKIMSLDLASMSAMQQDYFLNIQREIYEASKNNFRGTSTSPSTPHGGL